jgi:hypothetical protein
MDNQLTLFPEEESLTVEKGIDYIDLKDLVQTRTDSFKKFGRDKYFIYKTGGINVFMPGEGKVFPFVQNKRTGRILQGLFIEDNKSISKPVKWNYDVADSSE